MESILTTCINKQPNARNCFVCGTHNPSGLKLSFYDDGESKVLSKVKLNETFQGYPGIAHGGILTSILDEVVGRVAMIDDHHRFMMTVNMKVQFRNPVPINTDVIAVGEIVRLKGRLCKARGQILLPNGKIGCEAELTLADMPKTISDSEGTASDLGWRLVSDEQDV